jgi:hypothetical protein
MSRLHSSFSEFVCRSIGKLDAFGRDPLDWVALDADQLDVRLVVSLQIVGLERNAMRTEAVVCRDQCLAQLGILEARAHLAADELGYLLADVVLEEHLHE